MEIERVPGPGCRGPTKESGPTGKVCRLSGRGCGQDVRESRVKKFSRETEITSTAMCGSARSRLCISESEVGLDITMETEVQTTAVVAFTLLCPLVVSVVVSVHGVDRRRPDDRCLEYLWGIFVFLSTWMWIIYHSILQVKDFGWKLRKSSITLNHSQNKPWTLFSGLTYFLLEKST